MAIEKDHGTDPLLLNKIAAGILAAGLIAMVTGLIADALVHPQHLEEDAFAVEAAEEAGTATATAGTAAPAEITPIAPLLAAADIKAGEASAKKCATCHTFEKGGANKVGPNLWGIVGNHKAHLDNFAYSPAMAAKKDEAWDYENLNKFLAGPAAFVPGTKMSFAGLRTDKERANVIAWLRTLSDSPVPLP